MPVADHPNSTTNDRVNGATKKDSFQDSEGVNISPFHRQLQGLHF
jgi:hypothetical protein